MNWQNMVRFHLIRRLLLRLAEATNRERALLIEAVLGLLLARLALILISFPRLAGHFGTMVPASDPRLSNADSPASRHQILLAREVSLAVTRAARYVPFRAVCLPQAMAAHGMLKRRGVATVMHFGAATGQTSHLNDQTGLLDAHAWLDAAGVEVTGYPIEPRLARLACFI